MIVARNYLRFHFRVVSLGLGVECIDRDIQMFCQPRKSKLIQ